MKQIEIDLKNLNSVQLQLITDYLSKGKVIAYPTDTIYGLGCLANSDKAIKKIRCIKQQKDNKQFLILVSSLAMAKKYCFISQRQEKYLKSVWPGPVTVVLKSRGLLSRELFGGLDSLAIRLPKSEFIAKIIKRVKIPIVSTSLNRARKIPLSKLCNIDKHFIDNKPDLVVKAEILVKKPSKLIDLRDIDNIKILRK